MTKPGKLSVFTPKVCWDFRDGAYVLERNTIKAWSTKTVVDPTPCYAHDKGLVRELLAQAAEAFPIGWPVSLNILDHETTARTNGWATTKDAHGKRLPDPRRRRRDRVLATPRHPTPRGTPPGRRVVAGRESGARGMMLAEAWRPNRYYPVGHRIRWHGYLLECRTAHTAPYDAEEPWYDAHERRGQDLLRALRRWRVCADEMLDEYWDAVRKLGGPDTPKAA